MHQDTLIICYSRSGTTAVAAQQVARMTGWKIAWLRDVRARHTGWGYLRSAVEGLLGLGAPYTYRGPKPGRFRHVVLMGPVWFGGLASPLRQFIREAEESAESEDQLPQSVSFVCSMDARGGVRAAEQAASLLGRPLRNVLTLTESQIYSGIARPKLSGLAQGIKAQQDNLPEKGRAQTEADHSWGRTRKTGTGA